MNALVVTSITASLAVRGVCDKITMGADYRLYDWPDRSKNRRDVRHVFRVVSMGKPIIWFSEGRWHCSSSRKPKIGHPVGHGWFSPKEAWEHWKYLEWRAGISFRLYRSLIKEDTEQRTVNSLTRLASRKEVM